jgi:hypothetical protein
MDVTFPSPYNLHHPRCIAPYQYTCTQLHHNTWYFCKFTTQPLAIPTIDLLFPAMCTTQGSIPPSLHHIPSICTTTLPSLQHISKRKCPRCVSRNFNYQNGALNTYIKNVDSIFFKICKKLEALLLNGLLVLPCSIFITIEGPLKLYQYDGFFPKHFEFPV